MKSRLERIADRFATQLDALDSIVCVADKTALEQQQSGAWSSAENLAHLARHQRVFADRIKDMLARDSPSMAAYRAEDDPEWPRWQALSLDEIVTLLHDGQATLIELVRPLTAAQLGRVGVHSTLGAMTLAEWLDFFLVHQSHHLYVALKRARGARPAAPFRESITHLANPRE